MEIIVTIKHVPDPSIPPNQLRLDESGRRVVAPAGIPPLMNGYDANALEEALRLRDQHGGTVTVISVGDDSARETLKRAIAMGANKAILVNDPALEFGDSAATGTLLAAAIRKLEPCDLILCGRQASDTDAGVVLFWIAEILGLPVVSPIREIEQVEDRALVVRRIGEDVTQRVHVELPALLGVSSEINEPRYPPMRGIMAAGRTQIPAWTSNELDLKGIANRVELRCLRVEERSANVEFVDGETPTDIGRRLADKLHEAGVI